MKAGARRGHRHPHRLLTVALAALLLLAIPAAPAYADDGDILPGYDVASSAQIGHFDPAVDPADVRDLYRVNMFAGETLEVALWWTPEDMTRIRLFDPAATDPEVDAPVASSSSSDTYSPGHFAQVLSYTAPVTGTYSIEVPRPSATIRVNYELHWSVDDGDDDDIPGAPLMAPLQSATYSSMLNWVIDTDDVLPLELVAGDTVTLTLAHEQPGPTDDFDLFLCAPDAVSVLDEGYVAWSLTEDTSAETLTYTAGVSGTYYVDVYAYDGSGAYTLETIVVPSSVAVTEVQGADRIATAIRASELAFSGGSDTVIIGTARNWPDALGGSALAGALGAPILLTEPATLSPAVAAEIERLGATRVVVLGGTSAVSAPVASSLNAITGVGDVDRIAGADRYETARMIADATIAVLGTGWDHGAFVATGGTFPDALGASPISAVSGWPIYLARPGTTADSALVSAMRADGASRIVVLGGTVAVSPATFGALSVIDPGARRVFGDNRYETALQVAGHGISEHGLVWDGLALTTGEDFPDALAGGVMQGRAGSVMLLTPSQALDAQVYDALLTHRADISSVRFLGGTSAVSIDARSQALEALQ
ncbi:MAG: cell wall-binding repeat-containing protein [Coriobacteriia bacterium]